MKYRTLGSTGLKVSCVGFGGIPIQRITAEESDRVVTHALDMGINFFDSARGYTDSEEKLGRVLSRRREEAVIATKSMTKTKKDMWADIHRSLKALNVEYIDLYQLHNVRDRETMEIITGASGAMEALVEAKNQGLIGHIGITGHKKGFLLEAIQFSGIETVQFPFNAVETGGVPEILQAAVTEGVGTIIMKPLAGGSFNSPDLALKFILQHPVSVIIPGMDSVEQVACNAEIASIAGPLSPEELEKIERESQLLGSTFCRRCEYCMPCPQGVKIPTAFLMEGYFSRYGLTEWSKQRYDSLEVRADLCIGCGECEKKCPYNLPIREMLPKAAAKLT